MCGKTLAIFPNLIIIHCWTPQHSNSNNAIQFWPQLNIQIHWNFQPKILALLENSNSAVSVFVLFVYPFPFTWITIDEQSEAKRHDEGGIDSNFFNGNPLKLTKWLKRNKTFQCRRISDNPITFYRIGIDCFEIINFLCSNKTSNCFEIRYEVYTDFKRISA